MTGVAQLPEYRIRSLQGRLPQMAVKRKLQGGETPEARVMLPAEDYAASSATAGGHKYADCPMRKPTCETLGHD